LFDSIKNRAFYFIKRIGYFSLVNVKNIYSFNCGIYPNRHNPLFFLVTTCPKKQSLSSVFNFQNISFNQIKNRAFYLIKGNVYFSLVNVKNIYSFNCGIYPNRHNPLFFLVTTCPKKQSLSSVFNFQNISFNQIKNRAFYLIKGNVYFSLVNVKNIYSFNSAISICFDSIKKESPDTIETVKSLMANMDVRIIKECILFYRKREKKGLKEGLKRA